MVSKRYCQLIIFLNFIALQGWLFMGPSDCLEPESAFNLMLFYCGPLSSPLLLSRSSVEHLLWQRGQIIVFLCDPVKILVSEQNTRCEQQFNLLSLHIAKWASEVSSWTYCSQEGLPFWSQSAAGSRMFLTLKINQDKNAMNWAPAPPLFYSSDIRKPENKNSGKHSHVPDAILTVEFKNAYFTFQENIWSTVPLCKKNPKIMAEKKI